MALGFGPQPYIPPGPGKIPFRSWTANPLIDLSKIGPKVQSFAPTWGRGLPSMDVAAARPGATTALESLLTPAPRALNAAPTAIPMGPGGGAAQFTSPGTIPGRPAPPSFSMAGEPLGLPAGSPLPSPPAAAKATPGLTSGLWKSINAGSGSYIPQSVVNAIPGEGRLASMARSGIGGLGNLAGGLAVGIGAGYLNNQLARSPYADTPLGRVGTEGLTATQYGGLLGPKMAVAAGLGGAVGQLGYGAGQGNGVVQQFIPEGPTQNIAGNEVSLGRAGGQAWMDTALGSTPGFGNIYNAGKLLGTIGEATGLGDTISELRSNTLGKIPGIGGMFGGGEETAAQPSAEDQENARAEAANKYTPSNIYSTAFAMGIPARDIEPIVQQFKSQVAYMKASPKQDARVFDPDTGALDQASTDESIKMLKDAGYEVGADGTFTADDAYINQMAWQQAYQSLPQVQQQSMETAAFARRNAALQAEIAGLLPRVTAGMDPQMQQAVTAQMLQSPQYTAQMEQADALKSMTAQVLQQRQYAALQAAGLLPQSQKSSTSDSDAFAAALINQGG